MDAFAVWGEQPQAPQGANGGRSSVRLLVAGDPEDYAAEVEELLEVRLEAVFNACSSRPTKVFRLLRHLEDERAFNKFVDRDFAGLLEHDEVERRRAQAAKLARKREEEQKERERVEREQKEKVAQEKARFEQEQQERRDALERQRLEREQLAEAKRVALERQAEQEREEAQGAQEQQPQWQAQAGAGGAAAGAAAAAAAGAAGAGGAEEEEEQEDKAEAARAQAAKERQAKIEGVKRKREEQMRLERERQKELQMEREEREREQREAEAARRLEKEKLGEVGQEVDAETAKRRRVELATPQKEDAQPNGEAEDSATLQERPAAKRPAPEGEGAEGAVEAKRARADEDQAAQGAAEAEVEEEEEAWGSWTASGQQPEAAGTGNTDVSKLQEAAGTGNTDVSKLQEELEQLRRENAALKLGKSGAAVAEFPYLAGSASAGPEEERGPPLDGENAEEDSGPVTKAQIKRMKKEAKEVLLRPISEGFGFRMLQKMGWQEGQGLGACEDRKGLATPLWIDPREGKCGIFSVESGEQRPSKDEAESKAEVPCLFVPAGGAPGVAPRRQAPRRPPTVASVAPALLDLFVRQGGAGGGSVSAMAELLSEALTGEAGERFLRLVDERLGPRVAPMIAQRRSTRMTPWGSSRNDEMLQPLWQLTRHHVPGGTEGDDDGEGGGT